MSRRAKYDGPHEAVVVTWPPGAAHPEKTWTVERGHQLPADAPAALRDELLDSPDWVAVEQATGTSTKSKSEGDD